MTSTSVLHIRTAENSDIESIGYLAYQIWPYAYRNILSLGQLQYMLQMIYSPEAILSQMTEKGHQFLIASHDDKNIGFASFSATETAGVFKLHKLYVLPETQGTGFGKKLLDAVKEKCLQAGAHSLELTVNRFNTALYFYKKQGFKILREQQFDIGQGYIMDDYILGFDF